MLAVQVAVLSFCHQGAAPSTTFSIAALYYSMRFGAMRFLFAGIVLGLIVWSFDAGVSLRDMGVGMFIGAASAFCIDMVWNWNLKRRGIQVPGP